MQAIKELQRISPEIFSNLKLEGDRVAGLDAAYKAFLANLQNVVAVRILQARLDQLIEQRLKKEGIAALDNVGSLKAMRDQLKGLQDQQRKGQLVNPVEIKFLQDQIKVTEQSLSSLDKQIDEITKSIQGLSSNVQVNTPQSNKREEDALKKRLAILEQIKKATQDVNALVGIQEAIFDLKVRIAVRDDKKRLSDVEFQGLLKGFQEELNQAFQNQALALEAIPKVKFSPTAKVEVPSNLSFFKEVDGKTLTSIAQSQIDKATGKEKITITLHEVRVKLLGNKKTAIIEGREQLNQQLSQQIRDSVEGLQNELANTLGESIGDALTSGNLNQSLANAAKAMLSVLGSTMQQIGKYVIAAAIKIKLLKETLEKFAIANPGLAILAGIGLIAAGAALKNASFTGPKFAQGGIVTRPTIGMVGEAGKEAIIPLQKLGSMIGGNGQTNVVLSGTLGIRGRELVAFLEQEQTRFNRIR